MSEKVLFISARCEHSKKILVGIKQYPFLHSLFKIINIDTTPYPNYVKTVPTLLIDSQLYTGGTVFQYLGKLVEGKQQQEKRQENNQLTESDQGQCKINSEGELEGWCGQGGSIEYSMISEDSDDYTKRNYSINTNLSFLEGASDSTLQYQIKDMEIKDKQISEKTKQFDTDFERLQKERGKIGNGMPKR